MYHDVYQELDEVDSPYCGVCDETLFSWEQPFGICDLCYQVQLEEELEDEDE